MRRSFLGGNNKKDDDNDENKKDDLDHAGSLLLSKTKRKRKNTIKSKFRFPKLLLVFLAGCLFFSSLSLHQQQQRRMHEEEKKNNNNFKSSLSLTEKVKSAHREMARYVRVRDEKTKVIWRRKKRRTEEKDDKEELDEEDFSSDGMIKALKKNNNNNDDDEDYVLTHHRALLPRPRFLIGGASRRAMAALSLSSSSDSSESSTSGVEGGDGRGGEDGRGARKSSLMFEGRRKVPKDLPLVPEIPERLKRADAEYVTERRVIPVKPRIAPERPRGGGQTKKSSGSGDDDEEDERNSAEKNNKPSPKVASSSSSESSNAPTLKAEREEPHEHDEDEHEEEAQEAEDSTSNSSHEDVEEHSPEQKPTPMQKAVLKAATYRLGGTKLKKLLDTDVDIFLSKSTLNDIDPDDEKRNKITCGGKPVMQVKSYDQLRDAVPELSEYIPDEDDVHTRGGVKPDAKTLGRRCAVVGNSGSLLDHTYGAEIDSHDAVIRFNAAPTKGYEKHVGKKTTIRVQNIDNLGFREPRDEMLVFTARDEKTFRHFSEYQKKQFSKHGKEKTHIQRVFNPQFWCHVWDWVDRRKLKPSSGFAGVVLALRACSSKEKVSLYGFSHNATQFHYFNRLE